jgi:hypothetical protein
LKALSEIQVEGIRAASNLVDRFIRSAAENLDPPAENRTDSTLTGDQRSDLLGATAVEPLLWSWWSMVAQLYLGHQPPASAPAATETIGMDLSGVVATGRVEVEAVAGGAAVTEVWLHNRGLADLGHVHLRCGDLLADHGGVLGADAVKMQPEVVPMPARSSRGIEFRVEVADDVRPGVHRGTLLVQDHPDLWLPVVVTVRARVP